MTEQQPTTGATAQQIEEAAFRMHGTRTQPGKIPHGDWPCAQCCGQADSWADCFVPFGYRLAHADRVLDDADVAAIAALQDVYRKTKALDENRNPATEWQYNESLDFAIECVTPEIIARIERILAADAARTEGKG